MRATLRLAALVAGMGGALLDDGARAQLLITGNYEKVSFAANTGKTPRGVNFRLWRTFDAEG